MTDNGLTEIAHTIHGPVFEDGDGMIHWTSPAGGVIGFGLARPFDREQIRTAIATAGLDPESFPQFAPRG